MGTTRSAQLTLLVLAALFTLWVTACRGSAEKQSSTNAIADTTQHSPTIAAPAPPSPSASTAAPKQTPIVLKPSLTDAVSCRVPPVRTGGDLGGGIAPLQRQFIDTSVFPNAACNDGTPAVINFRPYEGEANRNKWVIALNGGGACGNGQDCVDRWCGVGSNFDADNMSSANAGGGIPQGGIFRRAAGNPFANWNQVDVRYCSSDLWAGKGMAVTLSAKDPTTGKDISYQINFAGAFVYEAMVATLRQEGVRPLVYTRNNRRVEMPDLDDASEVVFAGGSAGGAGVINNLDRFADALRDGKNHPVVRGLIDSVVGPDYATLNYANAAVCKSQGFCTYEAVFMAAAANGTQVLNRWTDQSCLDWHRANEPASAFRCVDPEYVLANHMTTPYFIRMGLTDNTVSANYIENGFTAPDGRAFTRVTWGTALREFLLKLQATVLAGHEKAAVTKAPGIFAPSCGKHYTILDDDSTYGASVTIGAKTYTLFDVWNNWVSGQKPDSVVSSDPRTDKCPTG